MPPIDVTQNFIHVRVLDPKKCEFVRYAKHGVGVEALKKRGVRMKVCCPKGEASVKGRCKVGLVTQAIVCSREQWTRGECVKEAKKFHKIARFHSSQKRRLVYFT